MNRSRNVLQLTLAILKPHIIRIPLVLQDVQNEILSNGFYILQRKEVHLAYDEAYEFYKEHVNKFFFNRLVTFMCSGPSLLIILAKENAIHEWRTLMGPTKIFQTQYTHPTSIRGLHGLTDTRNATHGSDSVESAKREIQLLFPEFNIEDWYSKYEKNFIRGDIKFDGTLGVHVPSMVEVDR